jgi:RNA polymerase sigma factor (TIGR02999 family)
MVRPDVGAMDVSDSSADPGDVTRVLADVSRGVPQAQTRLLAVIYGELKRIAGTKLAGQGRAHTLQPTALVHEAYLRLLGSPADPRAYRDRAHFFNAAAAAMRSILVDHSRRKRAEKRGGVVERLTLHPELAGDREPFERILQVHDALDRLAASHARAARVVELLFFAGLSVEEAAGVLAVSDRTVKRDWRFGRAWLLRAMGDG